jgi:hypothetical protein
MPGQGRESETVSLTDRECVRVRTCVQVQASGSMYWSILYEQDIIHRQICETHSSELRTNSNINPSTMCCDALKNVFTN